MNYYEKHIGDYLKATMSLSMTEDGAYNRLLDYYYSEEKPLPADLKKCIGIARAFSKAERDAVKSVLNNKSLFELKADGYYQKRADDEIEKYRSKIGKARASADARWGKNRMQNECERNANAMRTHNERIADEERTQCDGNARGHANDHAKRMLSSPQSPYSNPQGEYITPLPPEKIEAEPENLAVPRDFFTEFHEVWWDVLPQMESGSMFAVERAVSNLLVRHSGAEIRNAIKNYASVLSSDAHFYTHRHTLAAFLEKHVFKFFDSMKPLENFLKDAAKKPEPVNSSLSDAEFERIAKMGAL